MGISERKIEVLNIAKDIAKHEGLADLTIRRLAEEADISVGSVYNLFGTKDNLIMLLIKEYWTDSLDRIFEKNKNLEGNFLEKLDYLYSEFRLATNEFHKDWIKDVVGVHMANPDVLKISNHYKELVAERITLMINEDSEIQDKFDDKFTKEGLSDFIFENVMVLLQNNSKDLGFLRIILEKALYE